MGKYGFDADVVVVDDVDDDDVVVCMAVDDDGVVGMAVDGDDVVVECICVVFCGLESVRTAMMSG